LSPSPYQKKTKAYNFLFVTFTGFLASVDSYMNLQLGNTEEYIDGQLTGNLGEILIRCNNVLYVRGVPEDEELEDADQD